MIFPCHPEEPEVWPQADEGSELLFVFTDRHESTRHFALNLDIRYNKALELRQGIARAALPPPQISVLVSCRLDFCFVLGARGSGLLERSA
jgi:hypothetical protein